LDLDDKDKITQNWIEYILKKVEYEKEKEEKKSDTEKDHLKVRN